MTHQPITDSELNIAKLIINNGAISVRNDNEGPFVYSSGNRGPGYIMIKGLVGYPDVCQTLVSHLVDKFKDQLEDIDFVDGNVTGGMIYGWEIARKLSDVRKKTVPYVYLRGSRKEGGHNELITGDMNNSTISKGMNVLIVEELVNFGETTLNAIKVFRESGYISTKAACILSYDYPSSKQKLSDVGVELLSLMTVPRLLYIAREHKLMDIDAVDSYINYLDDAVGWNYKRGYAITESLVAEAKAKGYTTSPCTPSMLSTLPADKVKAGVRYYTLSKPEVYVFIALDYDNIDQVERAVDVFDNHPIPNFGYKINLDTVMFGMERLPRVISKIKKQQRKVFVDLKMWNGERTMKNIISHLVKLGVDIVNVYAHAGVKALSELMNIVRGTTTALFALTVLTHYDDEYCKRIYKSFMYEEVMTLSNIAFEAGVDGIICPAGSYLISDNFPSIKKLCPGVTPEWYNGGKEEGQQHPITPRDAFHKFGIDYIVVGRPITKSLDMNEAITKIFKEF